MHFSGNFRLGSLLLAAVTCLEFTGCQVAQETGSAFSSGSSSATAASIIGGSIWVHPGSNFAGASKYFQMSHLSFARRSLNALLSSALAASPQRSSAPTLQPIFQGPQGSPYLFGPPDCTFEHPLLGAARSSWAEGALRFEYEGDGCALSGTQRQAHWSNQGPNCLIRKTTTPGGAVREIAFASGEHLRAVHDTHGSSTRFQGGIALPTSDQGIELLCGTQGCRQKSLLSIGASRVIQIHQPTNSSRSRRNLGNTLMQDLTPETLSDETLSTLQSPIEITHPLGILQIRGAIHYQDNLSQTTALQTLEAITYGHAQCCFPSQGRIFTRFLSGPNAGQTEALTFSSTHCGAASLRQPGGGVAQLELIHCL